MLNQLDGQVVVIPRTMILGAASVQFFHTVTVRVEIGTVFFGLNSGSRDLYLRLANMYLVKDCRKQLVL